MDFLARTRAAVARGRAALARLVGGNNVVALETQLAEMQADLDAAETERETAVSMGEDQAILIAEFVDELDEAAGASQMMAEEDPEDWPSEQPEPPPLDEEPPLPTDEDAPAAEESTGSIPF